MPSKLRIKIANIEFEYEGEAQFSHEDIKDLFSHMESLSGSTSALPAEAPPAISPFTSAGGVTGVQGLHTDTIAARIKASSGTDLAIAAAAHLQIGSAKPSFNRNELLTAMKSAKHYYKESMGGGNLTQSLGRLVANKAFNKLS